MPRDRVRLAKGIGLRRGLSVAWSASHGIPYDAILPVLRSQMLDHPDDGSRAAAKRTDDVRAKAIAEALTDNDRRRQAAEDERVPAQAAALTRADAVPEAVTLRPPAKGARRSALFASILLAGDGAFCFSALADAQGIDLSGAVPGVGLPGVVAMTSFVVGVNVWAGIRAVDQGRPLRRWGGWLLLLGIAGLMAGLRVSASPDTTSTIMAALGALLSVAAGLAAGEAHGRIAAWRDQHDDYTVRVRDARQAAAESQARVGQIDRRLSARAAERQGLLREQEALRREPEARAAREAELRRVAETREQSAKFWHALGCKLVGRKDESPHPPPEPKSADAVGHGRRPNGRKNTDGEHADA